MTADAGLKTASPESVGFSTDRLRRLDEVMQAQIDSGKIAAISVMIARHGKLIKDSRYGYQTLESRTPLRPDAIYRIMSMTKPVTGVALMMLFEEGKWQLDDHVAKFIPQFASLKVATPQGLVAQDHPITMRELVTSTAGIAAGFDLNSSNREIDQAYAKAQFPNGTLADMIVKLASLPLEAQPGSKFRYGIQHDIQGYVVEVLSGKPFDQFLAERLFKPLGMVDTAFGVPDAQRSRIVPLYTYDAQLKLMRSANQGVYGPVAGETPALLSGAGGLYATLTDYMRFAQMLASGGELNGVRILAPSSVKLMMSDLLPDNVQLRFVQTLLGTGYGVNLGIVLDPGRSSFNHGALGKGTAYWSGAHGSWFWIDPVNDLTVVGMTQQDFSASRHLGIPHPAPDVRALSQSLIYQALLDPSI